MFGRRAKIQNVNVCSLLLGKEEDYSLDLLVYAVWFLMDVDIQRSICALMVSGGVLLLIRVCRSAWYCCGQVSKSDVCESLLVSDVLKMLNLCCFLLVTWMNGFSSSSSVSSLVFMVSGA